MKFEKLMISIFLSILLLLFYQNCGFKTFSSDWREQGFVFSSDKSILTETHSIEEAFSKSIDLREFNNEDQFQIALNCAQATSSNQAISAAREYLKTIMNGAIYVEHFRNKANQNNDSDVIQNALNCAINVAYITDLVQKPINGVLRHVQRSSTLRAAMNVHFKENHVYELKNEIIVPSRTKFDVSAVKLASGDSQDTLVSEKLHFVVSLIGNGTTLKASQSILFLVGTADSIRIDEDGLKVLNLSRISSARAPLIIENMILDGNRLSQYGIVASSWLSRLSYLEVKNHLSDGIRFEIGKMESGTAVNNVIQYVSVHNNSGNGIQFLDPLENNLTDAHIKYSKIYDNELYGIRTSTAAGFHFKNLEFGNNVLGSLRIESSGYAEIIENIYSTDGLFLVLNKLLRGNLAPSIQNSTFYGRIELNGNGYKKDMTYTTYTPEGRAILNNYYKTNPESSDTKIEYEVPRDQILCLRSFRNTYAGPQARIFFHPNHRACRVVSYNDDFASETPFQSQFLNLEKKASIKESKAKDENGLEVKIQEGAQLADSRVCGQKIHGQVLPILADQKTVDCKSDLPNIKWPFDTTQIGFVEKKNSNDWFIIDLETQRLSDSQMSDDLLITQILEKLKTVKTPSKVKLLFQSGRRYYFQQRLDFPPQHSYWLDGQYSLLTTSDEIEKLDSLIYYNREHDAGGEVFKIENLYINGRCRIGSAVKIIENDVEFNNVRFYQFYDSTIDITRNQSNKIESHVLLRNITLNSNAQCLTAESNNHAGTAVRLNKSPFVHVTITDGYIYNNSFGIHANNLNNTKIEGIHFYSHNQASIHGDNHKQGLGLEQLNIQSVYSEDSIFLNLVDTQSPVAITGSILKGRVQVRTLTQENHSDCLQSVGNTYFKNSSGIQLTGQCQGLSQFDHFRTREPILSAGGGLIVQNNWYHCLTNFDNYKQMGTVSLTSAVSGEIAFLNVESRLIDVKDKFGELINQPSGAPKYQELSCSF